MTKDEYIEKCAYRCMSCEKLRSYRCHGSKIVMCAMSNSSPFLFMGDSIEEGVRQLAEMQPDDSCIFYDEFLIDWFSVEKGGK